MPKKQNWLVWWRLIRPSRTNTKRRHPFHHRGLESKSRNRQVWPWSTKWSRAKANRVLPRERTSHSKHPLPTPPDDYTWTSPDGQHRNHIDYILCSRRWRSSIQSAKTRPGADCDSDHELLIAKFRLKLKNEGKTTKPFRYDLIKSLTVEVTNRFKGLDLIERVPEELFLTLCKRRW